MNWTLHFLGTGAAHAAELGSSAAVIERDGRPLLLIDCGPDTLDRYMAAYDAPPEALYITHVHMDHVGGMERLFARLWFDDAWRGRTRLFVHAALVPWLQGRVADYPGVLAEGGVLRPGPGRKRRLYRRYAADSRGAGAVRAGR